MSNKYVSSLPGHFPDLETVHASETDVWPRDWAVAEDQVQFGLLHDTMELLRPGFPSLNHVTHNCLKEARGVKIFQQGSRGHNFVLYIGSHVPASPYMQSLPQMDIKTLCSSILGIASTVVVGFDFQSHFRQNYCRRLAPLLWCKSGRDFIPSRSCLLQSL